MTDRELADLVRKKARELAEAVELAEKTGLIVGPPTRREVFGTGITWDYKSDQWNIRREL